MRAIRRQASLKLVNYKDYVSGLERQDKKEKFLLKFTDGYQLECSGADLAAVGETCILEDYQKERKWAIKKKDIVFDIGAHIGSFSIYAAHKGAKVYAFEPDEKNFEILLKNIKLNNLQPQIKALNFGVYRYDGIMTFYKGENAAGHSIVAKESEQKCEISVKTLKTVFEELKISRVDLLKIDVEGSEYEIFSELGIEEYDKIDKIVGEYHLFLDKPGWNFRYIKKLLNSHYPTVKHYLPYYFYAKTNL